MMTKTIANKAAELQKSAAYRSQRAREMFEALATTAPDNGARRGRVIDMQNDAAEYYQRARYSYCEW